MEAKGLGFSAIILGIVLVLTLMTSSLINSNLQTSQLSTLSVTVLNETVLNATNTTISYRSNDFALPGYAASNTSFAFYVNSTRITNAQILANGSVNVSNTSLNPSCGNYAAPNGRCSINYTYTYTPQNTAYNITVNGDQMGTNFTSQLGIYGLILIAALVVGGLIAAFSFAKV